MNTYKKISMFLLLFTTPLVMYPQTVKKKVSVFKPNAAMKQADIQKELAMDDTELAIVARAILQKELEALKALERLPNSNEEFQALSRKDSKKGKLGLRLKIAYMLKKLTLKLPDSALAKLRREHLQEQLNASPAKQTRAK